MAGNVSKIFIEVAVDGKGGIKILRQIGAESEKTGKKGSKSFRDMDRSVGHFNKQIVSTRGLLLKMGGTLLAAYGGREIVRKLWEIIGVASDYNETVSKSEAIFKTQSAAIAAWASTSATSIGMSTQAALEHTATLGNMYAQLGAGIDVAAASSTQMVKLAADLASFHNVAGGASAVLDAMASSFRGEYDALQRYIPTINAAAVQEQALAMTHKATAKELTNLEKALAAQVIIMRDAGAAVGDFERTSGGLANQQRILEANIMNLKATIGRDLVPIAADVVQQINLWIEANNSLIKQKVPEYIRTVKTAAAGLYSTLSDLYGLYEKIPGEIVGAAGYGIAGRIIFGGWGPAKVVGGIYLINEGLKQFNLDIRSSIRLYKEYETAINNIMDVIAGKRDWDTGELKHKIQEAAAAYHGKIGPETPGYEIYKPPPPIPPPPEVKPIDWKKYWNTEEGKIAMSKALAMSSENAHEEWRLRTKYSEATAADIAKHESIMADFRKARIDESKEAYAAMYEYLQFEADGYYEYRLSQIRQETDAYAAATGDQTMAYQMYIEKVKALDKERLDAAQSNNQYMIDLSQRTAEAMEQNFSDFYFDVMRGEFDDLGDYADAMLKSIQRATADVMGQMTKEFLFGGGSSGSSGAISSVLKWGANAFLGGGTSLDASAGLGADWSSTLWHRGGRVGRDPAPTRNVPAWMFHTAPRLHQGLYRDEYPAILKYDETVLPPGVKPVSNVQNLTISVPVTIEGQGDDRLASKLSYEMEETAKRVLREEMR